MKKIAFNQTRFQVMDWPDQSLDLNPIENLWTNIKKIVFKKNPTSTTDLAWYAMPSERCA